MIGFRTTCMLITVAGWLAGCATPGQIAEQSARANIAVGQAQDQALLLNVVRAYHRHPMHFTGIQAIKGPLGTGSPGLSFTLPAYAGADVATKATWGFGATFKANEALFDVNVWDGQEFMRGITHPIDDATFVYYLAQGWPQQMVITLLVREIREIDAKGNVVEYVLNYPENEPAYEEFQSAAATFRGCEFWIVDSARKDAHAPPARLPDPATLMHLAPGAPAPDGKDAAGEAKPAPETAPLRVALRSRPFARGRPTLPCEPFGRPLAEGRAFTFAKRSPEAAIYHLGELARAHIDGSVTYDKSGKATRRRSIVPSVATGGPGETQPLFLLEEGAPAEPPVLEVSYLGKRYFIPGDASRAGRSMHALSLVAQLLNAQKKASDLPVSTTIRLQP